MLVERNLFFTYFILLILIIFLFNSIGCGNKVEIPNTVNQCFKDPKTGECTNHADITVRHIISIELPTVFTDQCRTQFNETDYPDPVIRAAKYNKCISDYINSLLSVINGLDPATIPVVPQ